MTLSNHKQPQSKSPKKRNKEKLSTKDIKELMGMNMSVYTRHKGAMRRK